MEERGWGERKRGRWIGLKSRRGEEEEERSRLGWGWERKKERQRYRFCGQTTRTKMTKAQ